VSAEGRHKQKSKSRKRLTQIKSKSHKLADTNKKVNHSHLLINKHAGLRPAQTKSKSHKLTTTFVS
jgi:hypothetical protein